MSTLTSSNTYWPKNALRRLRAYVSILRASEITAAARRAKYRETFSELSASSDRDLNDIGIARSDIRRLAMEESLKAAKA